jgi:ADP-heptose:LPS heptosyltransferase
LKILVLSLLRLGDIILTVPALAALRAAHRDCEIHLLVNQSFVKIAKLIPFVDHVIGFDRETMQQGLVEADRPLFEPFDRLNEFVQELNEHKYNRVVNLTQNKFSGYLSSLVNAENHLGLSINNKGQASFGTLWFRYLNDVVGAGASSIFHYADLFKYGTGVAQERENRFQLNETAEGRAEFESWRNQRIYSSKRKIALQCLTSDEKKNWPKASWVSALKTFSVANPDVELIALGAPFEEAQIAEFTQMASRQGVTISPAILGIEAALSLLNECDLLVTGDTSIKHLALGSSCRVLEVALGSSDIRKTGAFKADSLIIRTNEACAPCSHEKACHRERHFCAENLQAELVGLAISRFLIQDWNGLKILADEYSDTNIIYRARRPQGGFWYAQDLREGHIDRQLSDYLDCAAWRFLLTEENKKPLAAYGSESINLRNWLDELGLISPKNDAIRIHLDQIEKEIVKNEIRISRLMTDVTRRLREVGNLVDLDFVDKDMASEMGEIETELGLGRFLTEKLQIKRESGLFRARQLQTSLNEAVVHQQIKLKLVRSLKNIIVEYQ